jgi:hypothetical protein
LEFFHEGFDPARHEIENPRWSGQGHLNFAFGSQNHSGTVADFKFHARLFAGANGVPGFDRGAFLESPPPVRLGIGFLNLRFSPHGLDDDGFSDANRTDEERQRRSNEKFEKRFVSVSVHL